MIIEVDGGRYEKRDVVADAVREKKTVHPVLWDDACQNTERYGVTAWPIAYLIGVDGRVIWEGNPQRVINRRKPREQLIKLMETELAKVAAAPRTVSEQGNSTVASKQSKP